jgi:predicted naringenin-chalcone synthase
MSLTIASFGTAVPNAAYNQDEALRIAQALCSGTQEQTSWLPGMYQHTGIQRRHLCMGRALIDDVIHGTRHSESVFLPNFAPEDAGPTTHQRMQVYRDEAPLLAIESAAQALERSRVRADQITHLVSVSCTGFNAPGWDIALVKALGLAPRVERTHVGFMGCHGALNGLRVARAYLEAERRAKVLLCATELCGLHYHYQWDPQKFVANAIFADGSAAAVCLPGESGARGWRLVSSASYLVPETEDAMTWNVGDHGFVMTLAKRVPDIIRKNLRAFVERWLAEHELSIADVRSWAVHPGGPKILDAAREALDLLADSLLASREMFSSYGNMSSPTVLFILDHLQRQNAQPPCVALGFGPGLNVEAALFR